jgi:hypothetical protein
LGKNLKCKKHFPIKEYDDERRYDEHGGGWGGAPPNRRKRKRRRLLQQQQAAKRRRLGLGTGMEKVREAEEAAMVIMVTLVKYIRK